MESEEKEKLQLEIEKIKLERLKVFSNIITVLITVAIGTFGVAYMNNVLQHRQLEQQNLISQAELQLQEKKAEADRRQAEMKYLGDFLTYALENDIERRIRFAEYFATLTVSQDLKEKWKAYHQELKSSLTEIQTRQQELAAAKKEGDNEKIKNIEKAIADLQARLEPLPPPPVILSGAQVQFYTTDDNKDGDTRVNVYLKCRGRTVATVSDTWGEFGNNSTSPWISLTMTARLPQEAINETCQFELVEQPNGRDEWHFNWALRLLFSDGTMRQYKWTGGNVDYDRTTISLQLK